MADFLVGVGGAVVELVGVPVGPGGLVDVWRGVGYIMVILIAGLLAIPRDYYEAASIDGASTWQRFRHITLPLLRPTTFLLLVPLCPSSIWVQSQC